MSLQLWDFKKSPCKATCKAKFAALQRRVRPPQYNLSCLCSLYRAIWISCEIFSKISKFYEEFESRENRVFSLFWPCTSDKIQWIFSEICDFSFAEKASQQKLYICTAKWHLKITIIAKISAPKLFGIKSSEALKWSEIRTMWKSRIFK